MIQGSLFEQPKEFRIAVVMVVPAHPPRYPNPYLTAERAEEVAQKRAAIVVTSVAGENTDVWGNLLAKGNYRLVQGEVLATSYQIKVDVKYLLDPFDRIIPLYHPDELPFYKPLIQQHYKQQKMEVSR